MAKQLTVNTIILYQTIHIFHLILFFDSIPFLFEI